MQYLPFHKKQYRSREVRIGDVTLGGDNLVRIQSMTNTVTMDTQATVEQSIRMIRAGCELVRITAPGIKEAENLQNIKKELRKRGYNNPLIADIHFNPKAAGVAAQIVEKVRINPGNYVDRNKFSDKTISTAENHAAVERIKERIKPLIETCKLHGTAMRIGVNHGSLSGRMINRFGNTPEGMVESAMEFIEICREFNYHNLVLSMKSSNIRVMVQAYRLLVTRMMESGYDYPLHLGVTEAGSGREGRIKSAAGIGPLLMDGIGDTIRVSLTEAPEKELPVARKLTELCKPEFPRESISKIDPFHFTRRKSYAIAGLGANNPVAVISNETEDYDPENKPDFQYTDQHVKSEANGELLRIVHPENLKEVQKEKSFIMKIDNIESFAELLPELLHYPKGAILLDNLPITQQREAFDKLIQGGLSHPVIIKNSYFGIEEDELIIKAAADFACLLVDGLGDGIWLESDLGPKNDVIIAYTILQATRARVTQTEYISCPSCGRTQFNIEEKLAEVKEKTRHLKNLKIGVMGCIVNGPGEMADADYGYVGSGRGKVTLYKGQTVVRKNIPEDQALKALIEVIKEHGDWQEA
ncbi:MAG: (E)-4-hydroxy-3-methylbut-2-enyl-diphosphate synthase [Bacteroidales bacterium]|nr:(E)-4-hydroxy-3-methylbut-2-enyl-diphosphate synthase [Bacteroidales bacterium]